MPSEQQPSTPLNFNDGPLVWIDCEMTGLDPSKDKILEIAVRVSSEQNDIICADDMAKVLITNGNLDIVDSGIEYVIRTDSKRLNGLVFNAHYVNVLPTSKGRLEWTLGAQSSTAEFVWLSHAPTCLLTFLPVRSNSSLP